MKWFGDHVTITRGEAAGHYDDVTGLYVIEGDATVIYAGPAQVTASGETIGRRATGQPVRTAEGEVRLPPGERAKALAVEPNDALHIAYAPVRERNVIQRFSAEARATFVRPEDRTILVVYG